MLAKCLIQRNKTYTRVMPILADGSYQNGATFYTVLSSLGVRNVPTNARYNVGIVWLDMPYMDAYMKLAELIKAYRDNRPYIESVATVHYNHDGSDYETIVSDFVDSDYSPVDRTSYKYNLHMQKEVSSVITAWCEQWASDNLITT